MRQALFVAMNEIDLVAPNGQRYQQPTGLFIGNGFVAATGQTITSIDPAYVSNIQDQN